MKLAKQVYIISDLHLGGAPPTQEDRSGRGFRMCTRGDALASFIEALCNREAGAPAAELVINGDFVDFLAEQDSAGWSAFTADPQEAVSKFVAIATREAAVFQGLQSFLQRGHRLTVLIGNHDIELSFPAVRRALAALINPQGSADFHYIYDGEAYVIGDALIEHGNRYDGFNIVNHDALRQVRSLQSRHQVSKDGLLFSPPPGSKMVVNVINPIKQHYPFVDLLKPETGAVLPVLLALEPHYRDHVIEVLKLELAARLHRSEEAMPAFRGEISAHGAGGVDIHAEISAPGTGAVDFHGEISAPGAGTVDFHGGISAPAPASVAPHGGITAALSSLERRVATEAGALEHALARLLTVDHDKEQKVPGALPLSPPAASVDVGPGGEIAHVAQDPARGRVMGLIHLLLSRQTTEVDRRLPSLLAALRVLRTDKSFDRSVETGKAYLTAATELADKGGFRFVIFGHTHLAKSVSLGKDKMGRERLYLNSGTWADLIKLPDELFDPAEDKALAFLRTWIARLEEPDHFITFKPTYVRLDLSAPDQVEGAELCDFDPKGEPPRP